MDRRSFLLHSVAAAGAIAAPKRLEIRSVRAARIPLRPASVFGTKEFKSDYDPARWRWFGPFSQLTGEILVRIDTSDGITGYGLGGGGGAGVYIIEHHLKDLLVGANALNIELLWDQIYASTSFYGRRGVPIMALSGIDLALWDIAGKHAGQPVHQLLGGAVREKIPAYFTGNPNRGLELGFRAFKLSMRNGVTEGLAGMKRNIANLREARNAIGEDALLTIDCLARWDVDYTLEFIRRSRELNLYWIEEPLYPDDISGYQRLCREVEGPKIASGEHEFTHYGFRELVRAGAVQLLQPDVTWTGGLTTARKIVQLGADAGLPVVPHRGGSPYGFALVAASKHCLLAESFGTGESDNELWQTFTTRYSDGHYYPTDKPGFGVELSQALLKRQVPELAD